MEGANDVGLDEVLGPVNRAVHMAFRREIDDGARSVFREQPAHQLRIADIAVHKEGGHPP